MRRKEENTSLHVEAAAGVLAVVAAITGLLYRQATAHGSGAPEGPALEDLEVIEASIA